MSGTESVTLHPGLAGELAAAIAAAGTAAEDLRAALTATLGEADEDAPAMERVLSHLATWAADADLDLRWRIDLLVLIDAGFAGPGGLLAGDLPVSRPAGLALLGRTLAQRVRDGLPLGPYGVPSGDADALAAAYPGLASALAALARHAHDPRVAGAFFATLGPAQALALLEVIVQTQTAKAHDPSEEWMGRDVRADLLLPVAAAFTTAARYDRLDAGLLDALALADGVLPRAAAGALLMEVDVPALGNPEAQAALWSIPLGYATWPASQRVLLDAFGAWLPGTADPMHPESVDRLPLLHLDALRGLGEHPAAAYAALTREQVLLRVLEEYRHGDLGQSDLAGAVLESGLLLHPHLQGWTADLAAAAHAHPEWGTALSHVITEIAALDSIPATGSDSLARLLAPHMSDVADIANGPKDGDTHLLLRLEGDHDQQATILRDYLAAVVGQDEGLAAFQGVYSDWTLVTLAPQAAAIHDGGAADFGSRAADLRAIYRLTDDALQASGVDWQRRNWLLLQLPQTFENGVEVATTLLVRVPGGPAGFLAGEAISRGAKVPSTALDSYLRSTGPDDPQQLREEWNARLQRQTTSLLLQSLDGLPDDQRRALLPIPLPPTLTNERVVEAPWYAPWQDDRQETVTVPLAEWDGLEAWLDQNAVAWAEAHAGSDPPVSTTDYWLVRDGNNMTASVIPYPTAPGGGVFDWQPTYE